jgi:hypothetical protein
LLHQYQTHYCQSWCFNDDLFNVQMKAYSWHSIINIQIAGNISSWTKCSIRESKEYTKFIFMPMQNIYHIPVPVAYFLIRLRHVAIISYKISKLICDYVQRWKLKYRDDSFKLGILWHRCAMIYFAKAEISFSCNSAFPFIS